MGLHGVSNDELAIEAFFPRESYRPGTTATLRFESTLERVRLQVFHAGPEWGKTVGDNEDARPPRDRSRPARPDQLGRLDPDPDRQLGDRPLLRPAHGQGRTGRVCTVRRPAEAARPESGRRGAADPHLAGVQLPRRRRRRDGGHLVRKRGRPGHRPSCTGRSWNRGVPPHFRGYDLPFLHWLNRTGKQVDYLSQAELDAVPDACDAAPRLRRALLPRAPRVRDDEGSTTRRGVPDRGGSPVTLSADNFCWRIDLEHGVMTRVAKWRDVGAARSVAAGSPVHRKRRGQESQTPGTCARRRPPGGSSRRPAPRRTGSPSRNGGIEIDHTNSSSPQGTRCSPSCRTCSAPAGRAR